MKRVVNVAKNFKEAEEWDIKQILEMSVEERQQAADWLKQKAYGKDNPDVREGHKLSEDRK